MPVPIQPQPVDGCPAPRPAVDVDVLTDLVEQIGKGLPGLRGELVADYLRDAPRQISKLVAALAAKDDAGAAAAAHQLRSGSALLGATRLAQLLSEVEAAAGRSGSDLGALGATAVAEFALVRVEMGELHSADLLVRGIPGQAR